MEKPSTARIALKWGIISAVISVIFTIILYTFDLWKITWVSLVFGLAIIIVILVLANKEFRTRHEGFLTFGESLGISMLVIAVSSLISAAFNQLYMNVIDNTIKDKMADFQEETRLKQGMTMEQIDVAMQQVEKFNTPGIQFLFGLLGSLFFGFIIALIIAAIMKKNRPVFE